MLAALWPDIGSICDRPVVAVPTALSGGTLVTAFAACRELRPSRQFPYLDAAGRNPGQRSGLTIRA